MKSGISVYFSWACRSAAETQKRPETLLCVVLCAHWVTINLYFKMSKSASCLSGKDIHSIFVSQMILQRCCFSTTHAPHSPSNQVCEVAEQRSKLIDLTICWGIGGSKKKMTTAYFPQSACEQKDTCREMHVAYGIFSFTFNLGSNEKHWEFVF